MHLFTRLVGLFIEYFGNETSLQNVFCFMETSTVVGTSDRESEQLVDIQDLARFEPASTLQKIIRKWLPALSEAKATAVKAAEAAEAAEADEAKDEPTPIADHLRIKALATLRLRLVEARAEKGRESIRLMEDETKDESESSSGEAMNLDEDMGYNWDIPGVENL